MLTNPFWILLSLIIWSSYIIFTWSVNYPNRSKQYFISYLVQFAGIFAFITQVYLFGFINILIHLIVIIIINSIYKFIFNKFQNNATSSTSNPDKTIEKLLFEDIPKSAREELIDLVNNALILAKDYEAFETTVSHKFSSEVQFFNNAEKTVINFSNEFGGILSHLNSLLGYTAKNQGTKYDLMVMLKEYCSLYLEKIDIIKIGIAFNIAAISKSDQFKELKKSYQETIKRSVEISKKLKRIEDGIEIAFNIFKNS